MKNGTIAEALLKAQQFEEDDEFEKAYECYKYAHELDKNNTDVLQNLAIAAETLHYKNDAIIYWQKFMEIKPEDPISYTQLIDLYFHDDKYEYYMTRAKLKTLENRLPQAIDDYKKAINSTTDEKSIVTARYLLAQTCEIVNKPLQAIDEYLRILDFDQNENVYLSLARLYYSEDKSTALGVLIQANEQFPDNNEIKEMICQIYLSTGDYEKALEFAVNNFDTIKALLMQGRNDEAYQKMIGLSEKEKNEPKFCALIAEYYYNADDLDNTLKYVDLYEKSMPDSPLPSQMRALVYEKMNNGFEAHFNWGKYYIKKNDHELALNEYLNAFNLNSQNPDIIKELINLYSALGDEFATMEFCERLVKIEKDDVATLKILVNFYEKQGFEDKVLDYLCQLAELNNKDYAAFLKLGQHAEKNRKIDDAIEYYQKYVKFAPNSDEKEQVKTKLTMLTTGEIAQEEGFLDKLIGMFSKK